MRIKSLMCAQPSVAALGHMSFAALLLPNGSTGKAAMPASGALPLGASRPDPLVDSSLAQRVWAQLAAGQRSACLVDQAHSHLLGQVHATQAAGGVAMCAV